MKHAGSNSLGILVAVVLTLTVIAPSAAAVANLPAVEVTTDNTVISRSCRVVIPWGTVIKDADGNGVIQVGAPDIEIEDLRQRFLVQFRLGHRLVAVFEQCHQP